MIEKSLTSTFTHYAALGDSLTEGIWDWGQGDRRAGFAHLLHTALQTRFPELRFSKLGVSGARVADVVRGQLDRAIALRPDFVTVLIGANDVPLTPTPQFARDYTHVIERLRRESGATIVAATLPNVAALLPVTYEIMRLPLAARLDEFNRVIARVAAAHEVPVVDLFGSEVGIAPGNSSRDGLHPNPQGYRLLADGFVQLLNAQFALDLPSPLATRS